MVTVPDVFADPSGPLGESVRREMASSDLVRCILSSIRGFRDIRGESEEAMVDV